ncbi:MAG: polysaccharide deacetylase family protein [candidate division Zixibacteria bacterium]|nr:polysaccharide deacetylase family protein [candidate division Zixibacteria bacterium]
MNLLVLTYHYFDRDEPAGIKPEDFAFSIPAGQFAAHCGQMSSSGYRIINPETLPDLPQETTDDSRQVLVTIDDGHISVAEIAVEILLEHRITPIVSVITDRVGQPHYMGWGRLRDLAMAGFSMQSHTKSHRNLTRLTPDELASELRDSKKIIEDNIGLPVTMLTIPMGRIDKAVMAAAREAGYAIIMTSFTGINRSTDDLASLRRFQVKRPQETLPLDDYFRSGSMIRLVGAAKDIVRRVRDEKHLW